MDVYKILVVGEAKTGKSTLIQSYLQSDLGEPEGMKTASSRNTFLPSQNKNSTNSSTMDFVLKILNVNGQKVRVQLWDMAGGQDTTSAFAPLFIRNAVGCIIIASSNNQKSINEQDIPGLPSLPAALVVNHWGDTKIYQAISVNQNLKNQCDSLGQQLELQVHHVNAITNENIPDALEQFIQAILDDQEKNRAKNDMLDDLWDESFKHKSTNRPDIKLNTGSNVSMPSVINYGSVNKRQSVQLTNPNKSDKDLKVQRKNCMC
ncbi:rab1 small gtp-binding protein [Stylonychia lemnae]|uniref:Rab1 small gtp-binding protein n=1 Tax=Stylonychia lemnae TaxID=5949 RepID=A0A078ACD9_STYLE|nr:rab1 small gtp-binding protein [Stylonychia lemnae]|eukprot:CDW78483.1 rab1 small gtp-binding protein [Stylonychia lemnae]